MSESKRTSKVPKGRLERLAHIGAAATTAAFSSVSLRAKRLLGNMEQGDLVTVAGARALAKRLSRLRGAAMKLGQMASISSDSFVPPEIAEALEVLRAGADVMPKKQVESQLQKNLGEKWKEHFREFQFEPLASASIGQVHRALTQSGAEVVLKIQYPGVRESIDSDVDNLASLLKLWRYLPGDFDFDEIIEETKRQLRNEADYRHEMENTRRYRSIFGARAGFEIPQVFEELCTDEVLTTSYVDGSPLLDGVTQLPQQRRDEIASRIIELTCSELLDAQFMQTDPNPGNYLYREKDDKIVLLDFGACDSIRSELVRAYREMTMGVLEQDRHRLESALEDMGFLAKSDSREIREDLLDMVELSSEPIRTDGVYDFGNTDLSKRSRAKGMELALKKRFVRTPPADTLFIQRKLGGTFLLAQKMRARVNCRAILSRLVL